MAYSEQAADLIRTELNRLNIDAEEKRMFGGVAFMINDAMAIGVVKENIMLRIHPEEQQELLSQPYFREMDFTGRPMKGYLYLSKEGYANPTVMNDVMQRVLRYNTIAATAKRKKAGK